MKKKRRKKKKRKKRKMMTITHVTVCDVTTPAGAGGKAACSCEEKK